MSTTKTYHCALRLADRSRHLPDFYVLAATPALAQAQALGLVGSECHGHVVEVDDTLTPVSWPGTDDNTSIIF